MNTTNVVKSLVVLTLLFTSCLSDWQEAEKPSFEPERGLTLSISTSPLTSKTLTKATSERNDRGRVEDLNIVLANGNEIKEIIYLGNSISPAEIDSKGEQDSYVASGSLPMPSGSTTPLKYHIGTEKCAGLTDIYLVSNYRGTESNPTSTTLQNLDNYLTGGKRTVEALKALPIYPMSAAQEINTVALYGHVSLTNATAHDHANSRNEIEVQLERTIAMISLQIEADETEELKEGLQIKPLEASLRMIPKIGLLAPSNQNNETKNAQKGNQIQYGGTLLSPENPIGGHGIGKDVLYMFENCQGTNTSFDKYQTKEKPAGTDYYTYLQVKASYFYPGSQDNQVPPLSGEIFYNFCLGGSEANDFDIKRNTHYQVNLTLKGWAGLVEEGKIQNDSYQENGDVSWRIDTSLSSGSRFIPDGMNAPVGGGVYEIEIIKNKEDEIQQYSLYIEEYTGEDPGIVPITTGNDKIENIIRYYDFSAKKWIGTESQVNNIVDGALHLEEETATSSRYTLRFMVQPFNTNDFDENRLNYKQGESKMEQWIDYGYRTIRFKLAASTGNSDDPVNFVDDFIIRQWLPLPVMDPAVQDIDPDDPLTAELYYSRFDLDFDRKFKWGPEATNHTDLNLQNTNGFDNLTGYFTSHKANVDFNEGHPESAMEYALFLAANSEYDPSNKDPLILNPQTVTRLDHYSLPSARAWELILQHGVVDPRFLLANDWYWTSTTSGTQSNAFHVGRQDTEAMDRSTEQRVRLIFRKNATWTER